MAQRVTVVIPAYNEEVAVRDVIAEVREHLRQHDLEAEIVVVDDGSSDATAGSARAAGARVIQHRSNRGYGAALKTGIAAASNDLIAIIDADGTYPAARLPELFAGLEHADMVVGARTGTSVKIPTARRPAKWFLNRLANYVSNASIPDVNSGLRAFHREVVMQYFPMLPDQFSWTTTITLAMHCDKYAVSYLPIDYRQRQGESKIVPWDAGAFAILILRTAMLFRPLRVFLPLVIACFAYGLIKMSVDLLRDPNISASAILAFLSALQLLLIGMLGDAVAARLGRLSPNAAFGVQPKELTAGGEALAAPPSGDSTRSFRGEREGEITPLRRSTLRRDRLAR
ncbi:MAG: glycosyltransferase family 2 protein [Deltaproteobacteria bacterium]|nr:glycosyltransferase family 2 protein [Deltaproteobacteria bacterium]